MNKKLVPTLHLAGESLGTLFRWLGLALLTGVICGGVGAVFSHTLSAVTTLRQDHGWLLYFLPLAGLVIVWSYRTAGMENDSGTNQIIASVRGDGRPPLRLAPLIFLASALTHLCGGSAGREGAALQIGGSLAAGIGRLFRLKDLSVNTIIQCGMAGLFSALFGTPLTAALFSLEVVSVGIFQFSALFPCLVSALTAAGAAQLLGAAGERYVLMGAPELSLLPMIQTGVLAVLAAMLSILFCWFVHEVGHMYQRLLPNQYARIVVGGLLVIAVTLLLGTRDYNGAGGPIIEEALAGEAVPWAFAVKLLLTALTLGAGYRGGEIVPTLFVGATFGCAAAPLVGLNPAFGAAIAMIALFCGVVNCPIASILLSLELFGGSQILFFALACSVSFLLSGKFSLYSAQKIAYSKLEPTLIDENAH